MHNPALLFTATIPLLSLVGCKGYDCGDGKTTYPLFGGDPCPDGDEDILFDTCLEGIPLTCDLEDYSGYASGSEFIDGRGVHIGTHSGLNFATSRRIARGGTVPSDYIDFLKNPDRANASWVGISVAIRYDGTAAPSTVYVERPPPGAVDDNIYTYEASVLRELVQTFRGEGLQVLFQIGPIRSIDEELAKTSVIRYVSASPEPCHATSDPRRTPQLPVGGPAAVQG